jgi:arsenical pump membrane protein
MLHAFDQVWPAFVLVTGLLLVGVVAERDGVFASAGAALARLPTGGIATYGVSLALVTAVTAILNLDTSVFFLTPVLLHLARQRGVDEAPYLYGAVFMSNAGSLFLPGSNLTNLIVLHGAHVSGLVFLAHMWPAAVAAPVVTAAVLAVLFRRELARHGERDDEPAPLHVGLGLAAIAVSTVLVLVLARPALPVLAVGLVAVVAARVDRRHVLEVIGPLTLAGLFLVAVALGTLGRHWHGPASLIDSAGRAGTAAIGAVAAVCINNLPASVLLAPTLPAHPRALLIGLNLGPNLAVTGSLSALLWLRVARSLGATPSIARYSRLGAIVVPISIAAALAALWLVAPGNL